MTSFLSRRDFLSAALIGAAAALEPQRASAAETPAAIALGKPSPFSFDILTGMAKSLAGQPYEPAPVQAGDLLDQLDFEQYQDIKFRDDATIYPDAKFPVRLFHLGRYFKAPVKLAIVEDGSARDLVYNPDVFTFGAKAKAIADKLPKDLGFAGFRLLQKDVAGDWLAFLGASYFRAAGEQDQYGLSARGLALNTTASTPEEFPRFTAFWLEHKADGLTVHALLDSQSITGAFSFACDKPRGVTMDVTARLFPRKDIEQLGVAPLTSMFWYSETNARAAVEWRPQVHDSDGLAIWTGTGERIWRPLVNPPQVMTNSFIDRAPRGFGLIQRDRNFENYQDDGVFYDRRPTVWVEPKNDWGEGMVQLVEIPTVDEYHDNIVAFWKPKQPVKAGDSLSFDYRLHWVKEEPYPAGAARVFSTRRGRGGNPATPNGNVKYVVDFAGGDLASRNENEPSTAAFADITVSRGKLIEPFAIRVKGTDRWRIIFDLEVQGTAPVDMRAFLKTKNGEALTETWLFQHFPEQKDI